MRRRKPDLSPLAMHPVGVLIPTQPRMKLELLSRKKGWSKALTIMKAIDLLWETEQVLESGGDTLTESGH